MTCRLTAGMTLALVGASLVVVCAIAPDDARAAPVTECTTTGLCYCVNSDFKPAIDEKVAYFRTQIAAEKAKGKAIGYLSVPLSTVGGSYFPVNREAAQSMKERIEARLGAGSSWVLNPTAKDADLPAQGGVRARQGDYMLMWTRVLEGKNGLGEDFDFIYFAGPVDFAAFFGFDGKADLAKLETYYASRLEKDPDLKKASEAGTLTMSDFRNYYGLRASVAFSAGAHDEWNVIRLVNNRRRDDPKFGVGNQLPEFFDGHAVSSGELEQAVAPGNAGACKT